tara:strand:- start:3196 stop:5496 length:2301 start_codon:yes stop_codon:yes gene_type:complete
VLSGFSHHHDNPSSGDGPSRADDYRALSDYMDSPWVMKSINGARLRVDRGPVPEILYGRADQLRREIAALPFQRKYRFGLLSFDEADIDVDAFNAGQQRVRREVDLALTLFFEALWPGIPADARPSPYVTTHTHTGRLEVNVALARAVHVGERIYSHNPDPPTPFGAAPNYWRAYRDLVNLSFGWADPEDPARRRNFVRPDWETKLLAEGARAGLSPVPDRRDTAMGVVWDAVQAGEVFSREDVIAVLAAHLAGSDWEILSTNNGSVTIGVPQAPVKNRIRLKGWYFCADFDGRPERPDPETMVRAKAKRMAELATAPERFQAAWAQRAAYNRGRYGGPRRPVPDWSVQAWLDQSRTTAARLIPRRHHLHALSLPLSKQDPEIDDYLTFRSPLPRPDGPDRPDATGPDRGPHTATGGGGTTQQPTDNAAGGPGKPDPAPGSGLVQLERYARQVSGPTGYAALIRRLIRRIRDLTVWAGHLMFGAGLAQVITPDRLLRFTRLATRLETLNARPDISDAADGRPDAGDLNAPSGHHAVGGEPAVDGQGGLESTARNGSVPRPDRLSVGRSSKEPGRDAEIPVRPEQHISLIDGGDDGTEPASDLGRRPARRTGEDHHGAYQPSGGSGLNRPQLGALLRLGQDLAHMLGEGRPIAFTRIEAGFAFRTPGVALAVVDDRLLIIRWARPEEDLRRVQECAARNLGVAFLVEDVRKAPDRGAAARSGTCPESPKPKTDRTLADPDNSENHGEPDNQHAGQTGLDEEDSGPSM